MFRGNRTSSNSISSQEPAAPTTRFGPTLAPDQSARWGITASDGCRGPRRESQMRREWLNDRHVSKSPYGKRFR
jgi:hypothetical protein